MKLSRRQLMSGAAAMVASPWTLAQSQAWPAKPISLIVPFTAGGAADGISRAVAQKSGPVLGTTVVVENRAGAATLVGSEYVARSAPDGYTLLVISSALPSTLALRKTAQVNLGQFAPITVMAEAPLALAVRSGIPVNSVAELVAYAKGLPSKLSVATNGVGTTSHLMAAKFGIEGGFGITDVPYQGSAQAWQDVIAGRVDIYFDALQSVLPHTRAGRAKLMAVTSAERSPASPETPTMREAGYPALVNSPWWGIAAPIGTPEAVLRQLEKVFVDAGSSEEVRARLVAFGGRPVFNSRAEASAMLKRDFDFWTSVVDTAGIKVQ